MKEATHEECSNPQVSRTFKSWGERHEGSPFLTRKVHQRADRVLRQQLGHGPKFTLVRQEEDVDVRFALHKGDREMLGRTKMLAGASEVQNPRKLKMHKSGFKLWVFLKNNFDRASTFNVISRLRCVRNMQIAKYVCGT